MFNNNSKKILVSDRELLGSIRLDSGSSSNVAGLQWWNNYLNNLAPSLNKTVLAQQSNGKQLRLGGGEVLTSKKVVTFPGKLSNRNIMFTSHIIDSKIPMLWTRTDMANAGVVLHMSG